jgi:predicted metal-dependent hydrolase
VFDRNLLYPESILYEGEKIDFLWRRNKKYGISIRVKASAVVEINAHKKISIEEIKNFVCKNAEWILQQQKRMRKVPKTKNQKYFVDHAQINYLGDSYRICVRPGLQNKVEIEGDFLVVNIAGKNQKNVHRLVKEWFEKQAQNYIEKRLEICLKKAAMIGVEAIDSLEFRWLKTRWGSCSVSKKITINIELLAAPPEAIDYVILHELCHIKIMNHGPKFYELQELISPDWKKWKKFLSGK